MTEPSPRKRLPIGPTLLNLAIMAYASYALWFDGTADAWWRNALYVAMLAFGLLAFVGGFVKSPAEGAADLDRLNREMYAGAHERRIVDESAIHAARLDAAFFDRSTRELESLGFRRLPDYVDVTAKRAMPAADVVIRPFLAADDSFMAAVFDMRFRGWMRTLQFVRLLDGDLRTVEFESELDDGSFVSTSRESMAQRASEFPGLSRRFLPRGTSPADLLRAHESHLRDVVAEKLDGVSPVILRNLTDVFASQDRGDLLKSRHRNSAAYDPAAELARIADRPMRNAAERELADEARRLHAERLASAEAAEKSTG